MYRLNRFKSRFMLGYKKGQLQGITDSIKVIESMKDNQHKTMTRHNKTMDNVISNVKSLLAK